MISIEKIKLWRGMRSPTTQELIFSYPKEFTLTLDEYAELEKKLEKYIHKLNVGFPVLKQKEVMLNDLKTRVAFWKNRDKQLLKEYENLKKAGSPFQKRKEIVRKREALQKLVDSDMNLGRKLKEEFCESLFWNIEPNDKDTIEKIGVELFFKNNWRYLYG